MINLRPRSADTFEVDRSPVLHPEHRASRRRRRALGVGGAVLALLFGAVDPGGASLSQPPTTPSGREQAPTALELAKADREVVAARLADVEAQRALAQREVDQANAAVVAADAEVAAAEAAEAQSREVTAQRDRAVRDAAVDAYIGDDPASSGLAGFLVGDSVEASDRNAFLRSRAIERNELLRLQKEAQAALEAAGVVTRDKAQQATAAVEAAQLRLADLEARRGEAVELVAVMDQRVERALAEAAAIAQLDAAAANALVAGETLLRDRANNQTTPVPKPPRRRRSTPTTTAPVVTTRPPTARPPTTSRPSTTRPAQAVPNPGPTTTVRPTTTTPVVAPPPTVTPPPLATVGGITVDVAIASSLKALLDAAASVGLILGGSGYRDPAIQVELRRLHCGPTDYDIWFKPASQCSPPTARPGQSMHERGLAVDLTCAGALITSRSNPCFIWLQANAAGYGFMNLPSEPWHWSTNGN